VVRACPGFFVHECTGFFENEHQMFADSYLEKSGSPFLIHENPGTDTGISVVIPCYYEPEILKTLLSLSRCTLPPVGVEVIVLINHSETASERIRTFNAGTKREIEEWIAHHNTSGIRFFAVGPVELKRKWAGAGVARKKGMDEAVRRFNVSDNPVGVIVSLDADTLVEKNYLVEIEKYFRLHPSVAGATLAFKHRLTGLKGRHLEGIVLYEKYMAYYKHALAYTGFPHPMFTVGSAFAVTAGAYVKRGGMNRRKAGEDFYFLQHLTEVGPVGEIFSTTVYPSSRLSDRVPFGTGPILRKWMSGEEDLTKTYNFRAFADLKQFFEMTDFFFNVRESDYQELLPRLPQPVVKFLEEVNFREDICTLNANCAEPETFRNRFFQRFNAFKVLKFLNYVHGTFYEKADLDDQMARLNDSLKGKE
jgi:glycosyltransferase involved in cell wall biosynthesis